MHAGVGVFLHLWVSVAGLEVLVGCASAWRPPFWPLEPEVLRRCICVPHACIANTRGRRDVRCPVIVFRVRSEFPDDSA